MSTQASRRLGREPEATDMLTEDSGPAEGRKEEVILHDRILIPAAHTLSMPRVHNPRRSGETGLQGSSTTNHAICKAFCHVFNLYTTVLFTDYARLYVAKPDSGAGSVSSCALPDPQSSVSACLVHGERERQKSGRVTGWPRRSIHYPVDLRGLCFLRDSCAREAAGVVERGLARLDASVFPGPGSPLAESWLCGGGLPPL